MNIIFRIIAVLALLPACKPRTSENEAKGLAEKRDSLLIVSGGFNSCFYFPKDDSKSATTETVSLNP